MIHFSRLSILHDHISRVSADAARDVFLVGGSIRDILCGFSRKNNDTDQGEQKEIIDIDATCCGHPDDVFSHLTQHADYMSGLFRTEKYGTMTYGIQTDQGRIVYEITPFREEGGYVDNRHPQTVNWSQSLLADAARRDFTVNCMYYTLVGGQPLSTTDRHLVVSADHTAVSYTEASHREGVVSLTEGIFDEYDSCEVDSEDLIKKIGGRGWTYIVHAHIVVVVDHELIDNIVVAGVIQKEYLYSLLEHDGIVCSDTKPLGVLFDPYNGIRDMVQQKLVAVGNPDTRFREDALRMLRALRFINVWNQTPGVTFDFHKDTWNSIKRNYHLIPSLAKERLHDEIVKVFRHNNPFGYVALLDEANLLQYIFPALHRCKGNEQPIRYHPFDTYTHIMLTLWHLQGINMNYRVKLGMLYHDVGKPDQYYFYAQCTTKEERDAVHASWANHIVCGAEYTKKDFAALGFSADEIEEISWYVAYHMRPGQILEARDDNQRKKVRLMYSEYGYERVRNLFDICVADRKGQYNPIQAGEIKHVDKLYEHLDYLMQHEGQFVMRDLAVGGDDIMQELSLTPGPMIGELLQKAFQWVVHEKDTRNKRDTILTYLKGVLSHGVYNEK